MHVRSQKAIRLRIVCSIALASLLAVVATDISAATLSGTLIDYSNYSRGVYYVYALRMNLTNPLVGSTVVAHEGPWTIAGVPNGHYFILAWRDVNSNFIPSRGEPVGYYGFPFPSRVTVQGQSVSGLDVVLEATNLGAEIRGRVTYNGTKSGRIWVVAHAGPVLELTSVRGTPWTMVTPGEYQTFVPDHGAYYLTGFMDVNGNLLADDGEPQGTVGPLDVIVTPGVTYKIDILLDENARTTPVAGTTWSEVKGLYQK